MATPVRVLWVDMRPDSKEPSLHMELAPQISSLHLVDTEGLSRALAQTDRHIVVVDLEQPLRSDLELLRNCRLAYPQSPFVVLINSRAEHLLLWLMRMRVWNVFTKPCSAASLLRSLVTLREATELDKPIDFAQPVCEHARNMVPPNVEASERGSGNRVLDTIKRTGPAIVYLATHYTEPIKLAQLAKLCRLSPCEFSRRFSQENGMGLREYILHLRFEKAKELLTGTTMQITDIAASLGFASHAYFTERFREAFGVSPGEFRRTETERKFAI